VGLQLEVGLEGKVRAGRWAPVRVTATNSGEPVTGRLELMVPGARTAIPLELPSAAKKRVETTLIPQPTTDDFTAIPERGVASLREGSARGAAGREIVSTQIRVKVLPEMARLLAVCGEEAGGLRFLDGVTLGEAGWSLPLEQQRQLQNGITETAHVAPAQMPASRAGLGAVDLLVVRDAAWRQLESRQRRAVRQWTEMGGRLLLCGEDPAGFQDEEGRRLLPVATIGLEPRPQLTSLPLPRRCSGGSRFWKVSSPGPPKSRSSLGPPMIVSLPSSPKMLSRP